MHEHARMCGSRFPTIGNSIAQYLRAPIVIKNFDPSKTDFMYGHNLRIFGQKIIHENFETRLIYVVYNNLRYV